MNFRKEFNGMLPAVIKKFEELLQTVPNTRVIKGYNVEEGKNSFFAWGCACRMTALDMLTLKTKAESLGIIWLNNTGDMAYTSGRTINDFKTFRVNGNLELMPEEEVK